MHLTAEKVETLLWLQRKGIKVEWNLSHLCPWDSVSFSFSSSGTHDIWKKLLSIPNASLSTTRHFSSLWFLWMKPKVDQHTSDCELKSYYEIIVPLLRGSYQNRSCNWDWASFSRFQVKKNHILNAVNEFNAFFTHCLSTQKTSPSDSASAASWDNMTIIIFQRCETVQCLERRELPKSRALEA